MRTKGFMIISQVLHLAGSGDRLNMRTGERFDRLIELMAELRAPDGCPWDREQTLDTLRPFILEEAYELVDAIDSSQPEAIKEELGDLLLEVLFVSQICTERAHFQIWQTRCCISLWTKPANS